MYRKSKVSGGIVEVDKRAPGKKNGQTNRDKRIEEMQEKTEKVLKSEGKKNYEMRFDIYRLLIKFVFSH